MAKVHEIGVGADTRQFEDKIKSGVIKPAEDAADAMDRLQDSVGDAGSASGKAGDQVESFADKLAQAARKAGKSDDDIRDALKQMGVQSDDARRAVDKLGDEFKTVGDEGERGARDAERGVDKLEDALKKAQRETKDLGRDADRAGDDVKLSMKRAEEGVEEFGREAQSTAKESAASFDGSAESIVDAFQEIAANAFAGFGPAGVAAGLAAAGGIGLLVSAFDQAEDRRQALEERAGALAQAYIDAGTTVLDTITLASRVSEVLTSPEQRAEAQKLVDLLGIDLPDAARILAGDTNALATAQEMLAQKRDELSRSQQDGKLLTEQEAAAYGDQSIKLSNASDALDVYAKNNDTASQTARAFSDALLGMVADAGSASEEVDELNNRVITLPDGKQIFIDAKTGQATTDITKFKGDADGVIDHVNARDIVLRARVDTSGIADSVNRVITQNSGKTIKIGTKIVTPGGSWDQ